jgi:hypothetical protein
MDADACQALPPITLRWEPPYRRRCDVIPIYGITRTFMSSKSVFQNLSGVASSHPGTTHRLFPTTSGRPSDPSCLRSRPSLGVAARGSPVGLPSAASSSCCGLAARGGCCRRSWAAAVASPVGAGCATGRRPASGRSCTPNC